MANKVWTLAQRRRAFAKNDVRALALRYFEEAEALNGIDNVRTWRLYETSADFFGQLDEEQQLRLCGVKREQWLCAHDMATGIWNRQNEAEMSRLLGYMNDPLSSNGLAWKGLFALQKACCLLVANQTLPEASVLQSLSTGFRISRDTPPVSSIAHKWWHFGSAPELKNNLPREVISPFVKVIGMV